MPVLAGLASTVIVTAAPDELVAGYKMYRAPRRGPGSLRKSCQDGTPITFTASLGRVVSGTVSAIGGNAATDFRR